MRTNQKGFGVVEILIVIFVAGLLGTIGWIVYTRQGNKASNQQTATQNSEQKQDGSLKEDPKDEQSSVKQGYKLYDDRNLSLQYPDTWTSYKENNRPDWVFFKSPDYVPSEDLGPSVKAGQLLEVRVGNTNDYESYEMDLKNAPIAQKNHGGTYETISIDGNNAILSDTKTHGTYWYATAYKNGKTYFFRLNVLDEDEPGVKDLFLSILATVDIK